MEPTAQCRHCGGTFQFRIETQTLQCQYCGSHQKVQINRREVPSRWLRRFEDREEAKPSLDWGSMKKVMHCNGCGAESIVAKTEDRPMCSFCNASLCEASNQQIGTHPDGILPFYISKEKSTSLFQEWKQKKLHIPVELIAQSPEHQLNPIFVPVWMFNTRGKITPSQNRYRKAMSGNAFQRFTDILIHASDQLDSISYRDLKPFPMEQLVPYAPEFQGDVASERSNINVEEAWKLAKSKMIETLRKDENRSFADDVKFTPHFKRVRYRLVLLPIWTARFAYNGSLYAYFVNGRTGKVNVTTLDPHSNQKNRKKGITYYLKLAGGFLAVAALFYFLTQISFI